MDHLKFLYSLFLLYGKLYAIKVIETKLKITCFYFIYSFFKNKIRIWSEFIYS